MTLTTKFSVHTLDIRHKISTREARSLKRIFGVEWDKHLLTTELYPKGINELELKVGIIKKYGGITKPTYNLCLNVNVGRLLKISDVAMTVIDQRTVKKMIANLNSIIRKDLQLLPDNSNADAWTLSRLDCGFDLIMPHESDEMLGIYMRLLNHALNLNNNRKCVAFNGADEEKALYESASFGNGSYRYNIYLKFKQMVAVYEEERAEKYFNETKDMLRVEKQIFDKGIANCVGSPQRLSLLADKAVIQRMSQTIVKEVKLFFGEGDFMSLIRSFQIIDQSRYEGDYKKYLKRVLNVVSSVGYEKITKELATVIPTGVNVDELLEQILQCRKDIEALGISVSGILIPEVEVMGCDILQGLYGRIKADTTLPNARRKKDDFGRIMFNEREDRYKCNFTIHSVKEGGKRICVAHKNEERLKQIIFNKLLGVYRSNLDEGVQKNALRGMAEKSKQDIERFTEAFGAPNMNDGSGELRH